MRDPLSMNLLIARHVLNKNTIHGFIEEILTKRWYQLLSPFFSAYQTRPIFTRPKQFSILLFLVYPTLIDPHISHAHHSPLHSLNVLRPSHSCVANGTPTECPMRPPPRCSTLPGLRQRLHQPPHNNES